MYQLLFCLRLRPSDASQSILGVNSELPPLKPGSTQPMSSLRMKTMLGLEPASFLPIGFLVALSFTEQPANKAVPVAAMAFKNCLLFILPSRENRYKFARLLTFPQERLYCIMRRSTWQDTLWLGSSLRRYNHHQPPKPNRCSRIAVCAEDPHLVNP